MDLVHNLIDVGEWVRISDYNVVQLSVVDNRAFCAVLFGDEEDRGGSWASGSAVADHASFFHACEPFLHNV